MSQKKSNDKPKFINAKRRGFLQGTAVAGGAAVAGVASAESVALEPQQEMADTSKHAGYKLTDNVRKYYDKARF